VEAIKMDVNLVTAILKLGIGMHKFKMPLPSYHLCVYSAHICLGSVVLRMYIRANVAETLLRQKLTTRPLFPVNLIG